MRCDKIDRNVKDFLWIFVAIAFVCVLAFGSIMLCRTIFDFSLNGEDNYTISVQQAFEEPGVNCQFLGNDLLDNVTIESNVDVNEVGEYQITYTTTFLGRKYALCREVRVVDSTMPEICLCGDSVVTLNVGTVYEEAGASATDNYDGDLTAHIVISGEVDSNTPGIYKVTYAAKDASGNESSVDRQVNVVDSIAPEIHLNGKEKITLTAGATYEEMGASATDNYDGDLTAHIVISGEVDSNTPGIYKVTYAAKDASGNESSVDREVEVKKAVANNGSTNNGSTNNGSTGNGSAGNGSAGNGSAGNAAASANEIVTEEDILAYVKNNDYKVSFGYYNLVTGSTFCYNENKVYYGASLIKTLDALYLYEHDMVTSEIKNHIKKVITASDNASHKYLVNYIGKNNLKAYGISLGATNTLSGSDYFGDTTVKDQMIYMQKLYEITKDGKNDELKSFFINNYANYVKFNEVKVMHKYGKFEKYFHESAIFLEEEPYVFVVLTEHRDTGYQSIVKNLSKMIYNYHMNQR